MLKIIYRHRPIAYFNNFKIYDNKIIQGSNNIVIEIKIERFDNVYERRIKINLSECRNEVYDLFIETDRDMLFDFKKRLAFSYVNRDNVYDITTNNIRGKLFIGRIVVEDNLDCVLFLAYVLEAIEGIACIPFENNDESISSNFMKLSTTYKNKLELSAIRRKFVEKIDLYSYISYLETQIDILSKIMLLSTPKTIANMELIQFIQNADKFSILDVKNYEKILKEFKITKESIKKAQEDFLNDEKTINQTWE